MRIRTIKPEFFLHSGIHDAERETGLPLRLAFIGLWCAADRDGRFKWEPRRLKIQILPYDDADFSRVLDALATRGFIAKYASGTDEFGLIPSFSRHQVINNRERPSELPEPLEFKDIDASSTRASREGHAGKAEGKGREQGKEGKGTSSSGDGKPSATVDDFRQACLIEIESTASENIVQAWKEWQAYRQSRHNAKGARHLDWTLQAARLSASSIMRAVESHGSAAVANRIHAAIEGSWQGLNLDKMVSSHVNGIRPAQTPKRTARDFFAP